jgi:hypothetical protein
MTPRIYGVDRGLTFSMVPKGQTPEETIRFLKPSKNSMRRSYSAGSSKGGALPLSRREIVHQFSKKTTVSVTKILPKLQRPN